MSIARIAFGILVVAGMNARAYEWKDYRQSENVENHEQVLPVLGGIKVLPPKNSNDTSTERMPAIKLEMTRDKHFIKTMENFFSNFKDYAEMEGFRNCSNLAVLKNRVASLESNFREVAFVGTSMTRFRHVTQKMEAFSKNLSDTISSTESGKCKDLKKTMFLDLQSLISLAREGLKKENEYNNALKDVSDQYQNQLTPVKPAEINH